MRWGVLSLAFILCGCAAFGNNGTSPTSTVATSVNCPAMKQYTPDQEKALSKAYQSLDPSSPLRSFIDDYGTLRKEIKVCQSDK